MNIINRDPSKQAYVKLQNFLKVANEADPSTHMIAKDLTIHRVEEVFRNTNFLERVVGKATHQADTTRFNLGAVKDEVLKLNKTAQRYIQEKEIDFDIENTPFYQRFFVPVYDGL